MKGKGSYQDKLQDSVFPIELRGQISAEQYTQSIQDMHITYWWLLHLFPPFSMVMASNMDHRNSLLLWYSGEYVPYWHF